MKSVLKLSLVFSTALGLLLGCATNKEAPQSGFLDNYAKMQQIQTNNSDLQAYIYRQPGVKRSDYDKLIIDPVTLYQTASESGITKAQIESASDTLRTQISDKLSKNIAITTVPGKRVARLNLAITGAVVNSGSFKPRYVIPIAAIIKLSSMASGLDDKHAVLVIETKVTDSVSGKLLSSSVTTINGETFRLKSSTPQEFMSVSQKWVDSAVHYATESQIIMQK